MEKFKTYLFLSIKFGIFGALIGFVLHAIWGNLEEVTITEMGASKKEIVYHGDTINTASRICSSAHMLGKNILFSKALHDKLNTDIDIVFEDLGKHSLKGKDEKIHIYSI